MTMMNSELWHFSDEPEYQVLSVTGEDAKEFLQGQLTQNVLTLADDEAKWSASCNHQGRVASSSLLFKIPNGYAMLLPTSIAQSEVDRLSKYILRSKVEISILGLPITYFYTGDAQAAKASDGCPALVKDEMKLYRGNSTMIIRLPSKGNDGFYAKFVAIGPLPEAMSSNKKETNQLASALMHEGIALIEKKETLEWLPQALNLDLIGAISFNKGCYTGQEIISKTQHLGKVKRRMFLGKCENLQNIDAGVEVFMQNEPMGRVIQSDGNLFLYVIQFEYMDSPMTVKDQQIIKKNLPYNVDVPTSVI